MIMLDIQIPNHFQFHFFSNSLNIEYNDITEKTGTITRIGISPYALLYANGASK